MNIFHSHFQLLRESFAALFFCCCCCCLVSGISRVLNPRPQRFTSLICSVITWIFWRGLGVILTFTLWRPVPHHLYQFPLMLTSSSCVIFNKGNCCALESLVALQYRTESNQAGGRRDRKRRQQAKQQTTQQSAEKRSGGVKKGEISWLQDVRNLSPPPQTWKITVGLQAWNIKLSSLTKKSIFPFMVP